MPTENTMKVLNEDDDKEEEDESEVDGVELEVSTENSQVLDIPMLDMLLNDTSHSNIKKGGQTRPQSSLPLMSEYIDPIYHGFCCPLSKQILKDPVTVMSGVTYEREEIIKWFETNPTSYLCPVSGQTMATRELKPNVALSITIEEWKRRNDNARIKYSISALSFATSPSMVLNAIQDLHEVCLRRDQNKKQVTDSGILKTLPKFLHYRDRIIRVSTLNLLLELAEEEGIKESVAEVLDASSLSKMLISGYKPIQHSALSLLLELSRTETMSKRLASFHEGILILIRLQHNRNEDSFSSEKAEEILQNLEKSSGNIKTMAENGYFEPLIRHLTGSEEMQQEMAKCLWEMALKNEDALKSVAEKICPPLLGMVQSGQNPKRRSAFRVLERLSSYPEAVKILKEENIVHETVQELLTESNEDITMSSRVVAAALLAKLLDTEIELQNIEANTSEHKITPDYIIYKIINMLRDRISEALELNLLKVLHSFTKKASSMLQLVYVVRNLKANCTIIELVNSPNEEIFVESLSLLIALTPYMGHTIINNLCRIIQPENLICGETEDDEITEKQAVSAKFLANLPRQSLELNLALSKGYMVPRIMEIIHQIQVRRTSRYSIPFLEGLVGIMVRFTATLDDSEILQIVKSHNLTSFFTQQLARTSTDEIQRLSALALQNLSIESINLSKPCEKKTKIQNLFSIGSSGKKKIYRCPLHRGICSSQETFCLVESQAISRLLDCLEHENPDVVEAALAAICTLLDDRVDVEKSVSLLDGAGIMKHLSKIIAKQQNDEGLRQQSFWVIEKFLQNGGNKYVSDISEDRILISNLVSSFQYGDGKTKQMAETILELLKKLPAFQDSFYFLRDVEFRSSR